MTEMGQIKELTKHAIANKMLVLKVDNIEMHFHTAAFAATEDLQVPEPEKLTDEEKLIRDKKQLDSDLFHSC